MQDQNNGGKEQKKSFFKRKIDAYLDTYLDENFDSRTRLINNKLSDISSKVDSLQTSLKSVQGGLQEEIIFRKQFLGRLEQIEENIRNNNAAVERLIDISDRLERVEESTRNNNVALERLIDISDRLERVEESTRNNNVALERLIDISDRLERVEENIRNDRHNFIQLERKVSGDYAGIDYKEFEDRFRGSRELVRERQIDYVKYFEGKRDVIDVGCGEGIFLEILREQNIPARGVDIYKPYVTACQRLGLEVEHMDAIEYIRKQKRIGGLFAAQLVEHLSYHQIKELSDLSYQRMVDGAVMILETPNPMTLAVFTHAFYMDPTHIRPIHPYTLQYMVSKSGFRSVEILFTPQSKYPANIPDIVSDNIENLKEFNRSMRTVSDMMFGSQDYAIIAKK